MVLAAAAQPTAAVAKDSNTSAASKNIGLIYYGDYVRVKHIKRNDKSTTQLISESNLCGFSPHLMLSNDKPAVYHEQYPSTSIFQVLPLTEGLFGHPVTFDKPDYGKTKFRLRHLTTDRYVKFDRDNHTMKLSVMLDERGETKT